VDRSDPPLPPAPWGRRPGKVAARNLLRIAVVVRVASAAQLDCILRSLRLDRWFLQRFRRTLTRKAVRLIIDVTG